MSEEYVDTTFNKVIRWVRYDARYIHIDIINGVKNLIYWFPTIWKDRDYDNFYIYEVLRVKLEKQAVYISSKDRHTRAQRDAEKMMLASRLITIQQEDLYDMEYMDYHKSSFNWLDVTEEDNIPDEYKDSKKLEIELISENFDEYFAKYPRQYKRAVNGELNIFTRTEDEDENKKIFAMEIANENQERSKRLLFKLLDNNINAWWD